MYKISVIALCFGLCSCGGGGNDSVLPISSASAATPVISELKVVTITASDPSGVAAAYCISSGITIGGGCYCDGSAANDEAGTIFACVPIPNGHGYMGGCYQRSTGSIQKTTPITVRAICADVTHGSVNKAEADTAITDAIARLQVQQSALTRSLVR